MVNSEDKKKNTLLSFLEERIFVPAKKAIVEFFKGETKSQYADCIIYNAEGKVLLLHRGYSDDFMNGKWGFPGGHIEKGELPKVACEREVLEETGLDVVALALQMKEIKGGVIHYFEGSTDKTDLLLNSDEHRAYEWVDPIKVKEYDLIADLSTYVDELLKLTSDNASELDKHWETIKTAFNDDLITEEQFFKARKQYFTAKKKEALEIIAKGFDLGLISEEKYMEALIKAGDPSHGGKLVKKIIIDANGKKETKWVNKESGQEVKKETVKKEPAKAEWWDRFKSYGLNAYPIGVSEDQVRVNEIGDTDAHAILVWKDPKTGAIKNAYTKEFLRRNAEKKWQRISQITDKQVRTIKKNAEKVVASSNDKDKDAALIIAIIAETGLRRGEKGKFAKTGNRGVSTLAPDSIKIEGDIISFSFVGKSYQDNTAQIKSKSLASSLKELQNQRAGEEFLFDTTDSTIDSVFDQVGGKGLKIKDMRTYVATDLARKILFDDQDTPPPLPEGLSVTKQKKLIQDKLKNCYVAVSQRLNNTPMMAKTSYIHPQVIDSWIRQLGVSFEVKKAQGEEAQEYNETLEEIKSAHAPFNGEITIDEDDEENCDYFDLPIWWDDQVG
jgi:DNA topoisomerase-1